MNLFINIILKAAILLGLNWLGWVTLQNVGSQTGLQSQVSTAIIVAVIFTIVSYFATVLLAGSAVLTLGLSFLLMPFYGWLILNIVHWLAPNYLGLGDFWLVVLSGVLLAAVHVSDRSGSKSKGCCKNKAKTASS